MPTYKKDTGDINDIAQVVLRKHESHAPILERKVRIDFLFAFGDRDETTGGLVGPALKHQGVQATGLCRKVNIKDRAKGMGDAEITVDGDWWNETATPEQQEALLDHELHHIAVSDKNDDLGRPVIKLRKHDFQFGWFTIVAQRNGQHAQERIQAKAMMEVAGQFYWPEIHEQITGGSRITKLDHRQQVKASA